MYAFWPVKLTRLRDRRERALLTQTQLAAKAGIRRATLANIEALKTQPRFGTVRALAEALGCVPQDLMPPTP